MIVVKDAYLLFSHEVQLDIELVNQADGKQGALTRHFSLSTLEIILEGPFLFRQSTKVALLIALDILLSKPQAFFPAC